MTVFLDVVLSLVAAFVGSLAGSWFWTFHLGLRWLRRVLLDESDLTAFWLLIFKPDGGVSAVLREEQVGLEKMDRIPVGCQIVIQVEADTFIQMRGCCVIALCVLCAVCLVVSAYTSFAISICFAAGVILSIPLRNQNYPTQSLATIFRAVRRWMEADRRSLEEYGPQCIRGIVRVIDANEPNEQSDLFMSAA